MVTQLLEDPDGYVDIGLEEADAQSNQPINDDDD